MNQVEVLPSGSVVGVLRAPSASAAHAHALAALRAGLASVEVTFTVPDAAAVIAELRRDEGDRYAIGAGTILTVAQAEAAIAAGADYLVSPHLGLAIARLAAEAGVPYVPGVSTPTEVVAAREAGCSLVKLFPIARLGGAAYLRDLLGPFPDLRAMVTGGVGVGEVGAYFDAGAVVVALGSVFGADPDETRARVAALAGRRGAR